jgi:nitroreductase
MEFRTLVETNRSYRRFDASKPIAEATLTEIVDLARHTPSAGNMQPLKYILSHTPETNSQVFDAIGWAAYLPDWPGPGPEERPTGYIIMLVDTEIGGSWAPTDAGIAVQTMLLAAVDKGLGGVMFGNIRKKKLRESLDIPESLDIFLVLALGTPVEKIVLKDVGADGSIKYYRDPDMTHHVPKRALADIVVSSK